MRWAEVGGDHGIRDMVNYGVKAVRRGECDGLHFRLFNKAEKDTVDALMKQHPAVSYRCSWHDFGENHADRDRTR